MEQGKDHPLMLTRVGRSWPILDLCGFPRPEQGEPQLANLIEKVARTRQLHIHLKELLFEVLIGGREGLE